MNSPPLHLTIRRKTFGEGDAARVVLSDVDLTLHPREFVAVVGASGVGKTTLLRIAAGLDDNYDGSRLFDGKNGAPPPSAVGLVFQDDRLLPWKRVQGNVAFAFAGSNLSQGEVAQRVHVALDEVGLADRARAWPRELSGGMAKRVAIARALVDLPRVLLLDEPFTALDAITRAGLQDRVAAIHREHDLATLLVTHDIEEAVYLADRILLLSAQGISAEIPVHLPRPRSRTSVEFSDLRARVTEALREATPASSEREHTPTHRSFRPQSG